MKDSKSFRDAAWAQLSSNKWGAAVIFTLMYIVFATIVASVEAVLWNLSIITTLLVAPVAYSYNVAFLEDKRSGKGFDVTLLFDGYKDYSRVVFTYILVNIYVFLWSLLFVIPGIVKSISYSQTLYILKDNPELSYDSAINRSMAMMAGHKWDYFCLMLSFIGWFLLVLITCGLASFFVMPYVQAATAHFYDAVKEEYENKLAA